MKKSLIFFAIVVVAGLCSIGSQPHAASAAKPPPAIQWSASAPSTDEALAQLRRDAQYKAADARAIAAQSTPEQREEAQKLFATAYSLAQQQDYESAKIGFQDGLAIDPSNGQGHYFLAEVLAQLNDLKTALPHYALARALDPSSVEGLKAEAALIKGQTALSAAPPAALSSDGDGLIFKKKY